MRTDASASSTHRADEWRPRYSGDAGAKADLHRNASRDGEETKRELECLTLHAADLLPAEVPWQGLASSAILLETPSRQMVPFSPFDANLGDANMLIMAKSGGGKTFMAQLLLLMLARTGTQISILERGDSYRPLVELMGGRVIDVNLDGNETLNPWDLPRGKDAFEGEIAFLKNLTRHMIGEAPGSDTTLVDNVLSEAICRTYKRVGLLMRIRSRPSQISATNSPNGGTKRRCSGPSMKRNLRPSSCEPGRIKHLHPICSTSTPLSAPTTIGFSSTSRA